MSCTRVITPETTFYCPGHLSVYNTVFRCNRPAGHGLVNVQQALAQSCNVFFYQLGIRLEITRIAAWAKKLGLGAPTGVDLPHELSGLVPSPEWKLRTQRVQWYGGETVSVAIGQGQVSVTPLQLARLAAVIANGGHLVRPHLVRSVGGVPIPVEAAPDLGLKPETLAVRYKGRTIAEIGRELGVGAVLEGSVRISGDRLRIAAQLVSAADGFELWSRTFDRDRADVFAVQDETARAVVEALRVKLLPGREPRGSSTGNREAYELLGGEKELSVVPGATHLFDEPGTMDQVDFWRQELIENE